jgi:hypothetical protein
MFIHFITGWLFFLIAQCFINGQHGFRNGATSLLSPSIDANSITITSYNYNPYSKPSAWIDRVFGHKSVHYYASTSNKDIGLSSELLPDELYHVNRPIRDQIPLDRNISRPHCSIEFLGYMNSDLGGPIFPSATHRRPVIGFATLTKLKSSFQPRPHLDNETNIASKYWHCYYRALYENWKPYNERSKPNFWPILFYCPKLADMPCKHMDQETRRIIWNLNMTIEQMSYAITFTTVQRQVTERFFDDDIDYTRSRHYVNERDIGVCLSIPYSSTDANKRHANLVILKEWIRYYSLLGFHIFVYDRDGAHRSAVYQMLNSSTHPSITTVDKVMHYYDFTIANLLNPNAKAFHYDNNEHLNPINGSRNEELAVSTRFALQGVDKTLTLTHCRFEAKAVYGIEHVIVVDYDEFLFCPSAKTSALAQGAYIRSLVRSFKGIGVDQLTATQRILMNKTSSTRDCVVRQANSNQSIFDCIAPFKYEIGMHSIKSIHLGLKCPVTGYHQACPSGQIPRAFDCLCHSKDIFDYICSFVHLSTRADADRNVKSDLSQEDWIDATTRTNEIQDILGSGDTNRP